LPLQPPFSIQGLPVTLMNFLTGLPARGRLVGWLLAFICAYRLGMPILYSAALAALPWLLLPPAPDE
jgi:hypothetical protein